MLQKLTIKFNSIYPSFSNSPLNPLSFAKRGEVDFTVLTVPLFLKEGLGELKERGEVDFTVFTVPLFLKEGLGELKSELKIQNLRFLILIIDN